jgi:hypothetical protein
VLLLLQLLQLLLLLLKLLLLLLLTTGNARTAGSPKPGSRERGPAGMEAISSCESEFRSADKVVSVPPPRASVERGCAQIRRLTPPTITTTTTTTTTTGMDERTNAPTHCHSVRTHCGDRGLIARAPQPLTLISFSLSLPVQCI